MQNELGTVAGLWRYPVKSMLGQAVASAEVTERGLAGDRSLAIVDQDSGKIASAKSPRLWRNLLQCTAMLERDRTRIALPDGTLLRSDDPDIDDALSAYLGRTVTLTDTAPSRGTLDRSVPEQVLRDGLDAEVQADIVDLGALAPAGTFFDFAPVHLISTSTLNQVAALSPRKSIEAVRYRPNIVITTDGLGFPEHAWMGGELSIGEHLVLRIVASTPRCAVPTLAHGPLPQDKAALRTLAEHHRIVAMPGRRPEPCAGVYAQVVRPGRVTPGDTVRLSTELVTTTGLVTAGPSGRSFGLSE
ncbi:MULTISPECIES: MOSC domain-containing protein [unclassified Streptomyces]|uniref:MOSC domain-containing protein n=1 Tax=unclassified Streptomyces TaxID=2593676 RepID=UPI00036BC525|nr:MULTISPECIES: MOSC domain-containing protein [unclassified Streptomyces]MYT28225.1 MOSC domain-containing protein [Streptomyces sp. SID8354]